MDPESIERYTAMAKLLNVPQGELINFIRDQLKEDCEVWRLQREQEKKEKLEEDERILKHKREEEERIEKRKREEKMEKMEEERLKEEKRIANEERSPRLQLEA